jgi:hypothetical protein
VILVSSVGTGCYDDDAEPTTHIKDQQISSFWKDKNVGFCNLSLLPMSKKREGWN